MQHHRSRPSPPRPWPSRLTACGDPAPRRASPHRRRPTAATESDTLTVFTHDAFTLPDELKARFAEETGYEVTYTTPGDSGALVNQLILTKDSPLGDVVFGIDNTFASRAAEGRRARRLRLPRRCCGAGRVPGR